MLCFVEISPPVLEKKIFERFLPYMGVAAILLMWPASYQQILISMYLKSYVQNLVKNGPVVSEKSICFIFIHKWPWANAKK